MVYRLRTSNQYSEPRGADLRLQPRICVCGHVYGYVATCMGMCMWPGRSFPLVPLRPARHGILTRSNRIAYYPQMITGRLHRLRHRMKPVKKQPTARILGTRNFRVSRFAFNFWAFRVPEFRVRSQAFRPRFRVQQNAKFLRFAFRVPFLAGSTNAKRERETLVD